MTVRSQVPQRERKQMWLKTKDVSRIRYVVVTTIVFNMKV